VSTRSLKNKLKKVEATLPPAPPPYEELPIEEWVAEEMQGTSPNSFDEEAFYAWLEELPQSLAVMLHTRIAEARGESWLSPSPIPEEVVDDIEQRLLDELPPHIERQRQAWSDHFPEREKRRRWAEELKRSLGLADELRTRENGYAWWFKVQEDYARLREKYSGFEEEWPEFFTEWKEKCEREGRNEPMDGPMCDAFVRICFLKEDHGGEVAAHKS
jgi:hypothetical protein